ncbi:MAG: hypothetical protein ACRBDI_05735 [Alphaproteobacteria bacterium]
MVILLKKIKLLFCLSLALVVFQAPAVFAIDYFETKISEEEKVIIAFFRAANIAPDYDRWIKLGDAYLGTPKRLRDDFFLEEQLRLGRGYAAFDKDKDFLEITAPVIAKLVTNDDDAEARIQFSFFQSKENYTPSFDFRYVKNEVISLIVNRLAVFSDLPVSGEKLDTMRSKVPMENDWFGVDLVMKVQVASADYEKPRDDRGILQWVMVGEIAYIKCIFKERHDSEFVLWDYVAPWYENAYNEENMPEEEKYPHPFDLYK